MLPAVLIALTLLPCAVLLWLLLRSPTATGGRAASAVYRDQLAEIDRDQARGTLAAEEADASRTEIERRLLAAARREADEDGTPNRAGRLALAVALGLLPLAAGGLYLRLGTPEQPGAPFAERPTAPTIEELRARLLTDPQDAEAWTQLADALTEAERYADAVPAYREAVRLTGAQDRRLVGALAETLVLAGGEVSPEAAAIFEQIKARAPTDPQASYYLALRDFEAGRYAEAEAALADLLARSPSGAPWRAEVEDLLERVRAAR